MVFATLPAGLVKQFSERADVEVAYLAQDEEYKDHMNVAGPSIKADALWNLGINWRRRAHRNYRGQPCRLQQQLSICQQPRHTRTQPSGG